MDYKSLLQKYMGYIGDIEGTDFTGRSLELDNRFSNEQKKELKQLNKANSYRDEGKVKFAKQK